MWAVLLAMFLLAGCAPTPAASQKINPTATPRPVATAYIMPTPPPAPACPGAPRERLILQERGRVLPDDPRPINLRSDPGRNSHAEAQIPIRSIFYVLEGPICQDNFAWYHIRFQNEEGWIAEGDLTGYYVEPYLVG